MGRRWWGCALAVAMWGLSGAALAGDWPFYRHDVFGTSNPGEPLTASQAQGLKTLWKADSHGIIGNPVVANGMVYVTSADGSLRAIDAATGTTRWTRASRVNGPFHCFPNSTSSTWKGPIGAPAVIGSTVYMPGGDGVVYAYDAATGAIRWQTRIADVPTKGEFLWSSAFPVNDRIYFGIASLHDCLLVPGRVVALDTSGNVVGTWWGDANHGSGAGVWTQPAYDARTNRIFLTTGTIAEGKTPSQQPLADAFVAFDSLSMETVDHFTPITAGYWEDFDFGTSPVLYDTADGRHWIAAANKNGFVYALDRDHLSAGVIWTYQISGAGASPDLGESTISSPAYANGTLFVAGGKTADGFSGAVAALDPATGRAKWVFHPPNGGFMLAALTAVGDVLLVPATKLVTQTGSVLYVLEQSTGKVLFSLPTPGAIFAPPTYANGVLYVGDLNGTLWALVPPSGTGGGGGGGGGGASTFADDFNRTSGLGANWVVAHGAFSTDGAAALGTAASSYAVWTGSPAADVSVAVSLTAPLPATYAGVIARADPSAPDGKHYAAFVMPDGSVGLARRTAWSYVYLGTGPKLAAGKHVLGLTVTGAGPVVLSVTVDGAEVLHANDSSSAALTSSGKAGIFDYNGARAALDDFTVGPPGGTGGGGGGGGGESGGAVLFSDAFNRSGSLGASWKVAHGSFSANGAAAIGTAAQSYAFWTGSPSADVIVSATLAPPTVSTYVGVIARASPGAPDANHYAAFYFPDGSIGVARRTQWNYTYLGTAPRPAAGNHVLALRASGANPVTLSVTIDGAEVIHVTDSSAQALTVAGLAGLFDYNGRSWPLDDFTVSTPATAAPLRALAADDFSSAGPLASGWQVWEGGFEVSSGGARPAASRAYATLGQDIPDFVQVSAIVAPAEGHGGVIARASTSTLGRSHYSAWLDVDGSVHIARVSGDQSTVLADAQPGLLGPHKLTLQVSGAQPVHLSLFMDDNPVIDLIDAAPEALSAPGAAGIFCQDGAGPTFQQFRALQP